MTTTVATSRAHEFIAARAEFRSHGALRGTGANTLSGMHSGVGVLPEPYRSEFLAALPTPGPHGHPGGYGQPGTIAYVVFSYATPIAWYVLDKGWVRPDVKYSVTTSRHQGQCPREQVSA